MDALALPEGGHVEPLEARIRALEAELASLRAARSASQPPATDLRFAELADAVPGLMFACTSAGNDYVNRYYVDYTGLPAEQLLGTRWHQAAHPDDLATLRRVASDATAQAAPLDYELRLRRHDGEYRWFLLRAQPVWDAAIEDWRWFGIGMDVHDRHLSEAALRESEQRFRLVADAAPVPMWIADPAGNADWVNVAWLALTGRSLEQVYREGWRAGLHPDDVEQVRAVLADAAARRTGYRTEYRLRGADGSWRVLEETGVPRHTADHLFLGFVGCSVDVTETRAAASQMAEREELLRLALLATELGTWDLNLRTQELAWSWRCKALFGISPDVPVSMIDFYNGLHPDDRARVAEVFARAVDPAIRGPYDVEYRTIGREDGVERWVAAKGRAFFDAQGHGIRAIGTVLDITARKHSEAALRASEEALRRAATDLEQRVAERTAQLAESEARFRAYFESVEDCLFTVDVMPDGRFRHGGYNPYGERRSGYSNADIVGHPVGDFMPADQAQGLETSFRHVCASGTTRFTRRLRFPAGDGVFDTLMVPVRDAAGRVTRILGSSREVTDQVRLEEELRQTQKMQAIGQLTGGVAHDFNNLLTGIVGSLELMDRDINTERGRKLLAAARRSAQRGAQLTGQLLAFSRRQQLQARPTDLNALVIGMAGMLRSTLGGAMDVSTALAPGLWPAFADPTQLELAILNLAINARDAMSGAGTVVIETANVLTGPPQTAEDPPEGEFVCVSVRDSGTGMTPEVLARVFEPFFTTKEVGHGSGLGLPQVLGVTKQLGGGVTVESLLGQGTAVRIYLPRAAPDEAAQFDGADGATTTRLPPARVVLLVDDDAEVREVAADLLESLGCKVLRAPGGVEALEALAMTPRIDAAVIDYAMPGMNGLETAARLRAARPGLPVVYATGYADVTALQVLGAPVVRKPFEAADLAAVLAPLLGEPIAADAARYAATTPVSSASSPNAAAISARV